MHNLYLLIIFVILIVLFFVFIPYNSINKETITMYQIPKNATDQKYEGQIYDTSNNQVVFNPYNLEYNIWRSSGFPYNPISYKTDNANVSNYGTQNFIKWDLEKTLHYFPYRHYNNYGMYDILSKP